MAKLKQIPYEGNEYYYGVTIDHFKNIALGVSGVLIYNIINGAANWGNPGMYGVFTLILLSGAVHLLLKSHKNWGYGRVSTFKYKDFAAKFINIILLGFCGVFCSYAYDIMIVSNDAPGKTQFEVSIYICKAGAWMLAYIFLSMLFTHFAINKVIEPAAMQKA
ncbi:hypothetical protein [Serratia proteamaculans]|uniref:hypothetical protein n=1 Tax=Serratia proteamaculans TaxID=28151 RepID=UPI003D05E02A